MVSLIPLALILGDVTEGVVGGSVVRVIKHRHISLLVHTSADLALRFGSIIGGLLNATFGNIVEVILSIAALERGLYVVVATSLVGSVLSNLLLVLGKPKLLQPALHSNSHINDIHIAMTNLSAFSISLFSCASCQVAASSLVACTTRCRLSMPRATGPLAPSCEWMLIFCLAVHVTGLTIYNFSAGHPYSFLAAIGVAIPTAARFMMDPNDPHTEVKTLWISRGAAIILFFWCVASNMTMAWS